jgi:outer membrane protein TolC
MNRIYIIFVYPFIIFGIHGFLFSSSLTIQECLDRAQQNSYLLKSESQKAEAAENSFQTEHSHALPQFSGELSAEQRYLAPYRFRQSWALVHADWSLGNFFLKSPQATRQDALAVKAQLEQSRLEVSQRVSSLFINILLKQTQDNVLKKRLELLKSHFNVAEALWQTGVRTRLDVLQTETEMWQLQEEMAMLDIEQGKLWQELSRLINWQTSEIPQFSPLDGAEISARPLPEIDGYFLAEHPLMQALSFRVNAEKVRRKAVTAEQLPQFHLAGGYFADDDPTGDGNYWRVDAGISLPLFRWGVSKFKRQRSEAIIRSVEEHKLDMERELTIQVQQILQNLKKLKDVLLLQENRLETAEKGFQFAEANYQAGFITNLDYLASQQQLAESHIAIRETQLKYVMNLIEFYITTNQVDAIERLK